MINFFSHRRNFASSSFQSLKGWVSPTGRWWHHGTHRHRHRHLSEGAHWGHVWGHRRRLRHHRRHVHGGGSHGTQHFVSFLAVFEWNRGGSGENRDVNWTSPAPWHFYAFWSSHSLSFSDKTKIVTTDLSDQDVQIKKADSICSLFVGCWLLVLFLCDCCCCCCCCYCFYCCYCLLLLLVAQ